jgi:SPW repeat
MARFKLFSEHKTWEDLATLLLGFVLMISPWIVSQTDNGTAVANAGIIGFLLILLAGFEMSRLQRWEEVAMLLLGLWMIAAPYTLGYETNTPLATVHQVMGALVSLLAVLQLWQDWDFSDDELSGRTR